MGVHGLWHLLQSTGRPVTLESLEGKVLAVDVSLWLHQMMKGMRDSHGNPIPNAHLIGLYHRICKLLFYRIKPVFVFDGGVPVLKKQTIFARREKRDEASETSSKATTRLLSNVLKQHAVSTALGRTPSTSRVLTPTKPKQPDLFELRALPESDQPLDHDDDGGETSIQDKIDALPATDIDIESEEFKLLPPEMRHEILTDFKEHQMFSARTNFDKLPRDSEGFADFQMQKFLKQTELSQRIADIRRELKADQIVEVANISEHHHVESSRLASEDSSHYILIKGLSKSRQCEVAASLAEEDIDAVVKKDKIDKHDFWVEKRRQQARMPQTDDHLPKDRRPLVKIEDVAMSEESSSDEGEGNAKSEITDYSKEGGFCKEDEKKGEEEIEEIGDEELAGVEMDSLSSDDGGEAKVNDYSPRCLTEGNLSPDSVKDFIEAEDKAATKAMPLPSPQAEVNTEESRMSESDEDSDEDFIEVKVDPTAEQHEDDLFPASIFATSHSDKEEEIEALASDNEFDGMSKDELADLQIVLERESADLHQTKNQQERIATSITDQMNIEAQELVRLFGLPYVVSPMEAEAQCAFLDLTSQTNGTVTDDSDIWLFGGRSVYKNLFNSKRHVEWYCFDDLDRQLMLTRAKLINLALVCGSDYTSGIYGAGPVAAMEIMGEFPGEGLEPLKLFKQWWDEAQTKVKGQESKVKIKMRKLTLSEGFPSEAVVDAYMNPTVDESTSAFSWGRPDLDLLRQYATDKFGWTSVKIDETLLPVMKQLNAKQDSQLRMTQFFPTEMTEKRKLKSQRVKRVLNVARSSPVKKIRTAAPPGAKTKTQHCGGFVLKKSEIEEKLNLSESSGDDDDFPNDNVLRNIDLDFFQRGKDLKSKNKSTKSSFKRRKIKNSKKNS